MTSCDGREGVYDVHDARAFVGATLERFCRSNAARGRFALSADERAELVSEGLVILYELARDYEPRREGYGQPGRFSGYAAVMLPRRLGDAWHRMHREHQRVARPDGSARWIYGDQPLALDVMREADWPLPDSADERDWVDLELNLSSALEFEGERELTIRAGVLYARGFKRSEIAWLLSRPEDDIRACEARLRRAAVRLALAPAPSQLALFD